MRIDLYKRQYMAMTGHEGEAIDVQGLKASLQKFKTYKVDPKANFSDMNTAIAGKQDKIMATYRLILNY